MNQFNGIGRITKDPELKVTSNGTECCDFCIAIRRQFTKADETDFINCRAWRKTAAFINSYFSKGKMIAVSGDLRIDRYVDDNGNNRNYAYINVSNVYFCGDNAGTTSNQNTNIANESEEVADEDLPF